MKPFHTISRWIDASAYAAARPVAHFMFYRHRLLFQMTLLLLAASTVLALAKQFEWAWATAIVMSMFAALCFYSKGLYDGMSTAYEELTARSDKKEEAEE